MCMCVIMTKISVWKVGLHPNNLIIAIESTHTGIYMFVIINYK